MLVKLKVICAVAEESWVALVDCLITAIASDGAQINVTGTVGSTIKLYWGVSKTAMVNEEDMADTAGDYEVTIATMSPTTKYYFYIKDTSAGEQARTGIYSFTTLAA